ncbi:PQQ-binding-like beta-propeller repeat protein [Streptomyces sp. NBC_00996]|uniref:outer membrane protein assembly factor BamB family protein n=1 Tax=Streptomyces sp. NBC_00996 TaxID=2903710 RepID=UPI003866F4D4|nr:PQQ-binding-like beta-propeller repeat protein [Streptomyces sp. NBC_00996]
MSFGPPPSVFTQSALSADSARRKRRRTRLIGAVAVMVVATLCAGGWLLFATDDATLANRRQTAAPQAPDEIRETVEKLPSTPEGELVIDFDEEKFQDDETRYAPGTWATDKIFAKGIKNTITGFKFGVDEAAWSIKLDGHICATTKHVTADGRTAVVVQPYKRKGTKDAGICDEVVFFDLDTGKKLWTATMPDAKTAYVTNTNLSMARGTVAVAWGNGSVAYDMSSGKQLWKSTDVSTCEDVGFAGGRSLLVLLRCGEESTHAYRVQKIDPRTGRPQWTYKLKDGISGVYMPSSDPPVLAVGAGDYGVTDLITLDDQGRHSATISMRGGRFDPMCGDSFDGTQYFGVMENCYAMVVGNGQIFVASKADGDVDQAENWIVGFDAKTGKTLRKFDGRPLQPLWPVKMSGDKLLVYRPSSDNIGPAAIVSIDPATGKETPFLFFNLPDDASRMETPEWSDILVEHGRAFFSPRQLSAPASAPHDPVTAAVGIGPVH